MSTLTDKIQKLLSLATSDNENEAKLASKKAQELLIKYNLSMADVENQEASDYETHDGELKRDPASKYIYALLNEYFFVYIYTQRKKGSEGSVKFIGRPDNLKIALFVSRFLDHSFKSLYKAENKEKAWKGKHRNAFYLGLYKGLKEQFQAQKDAIDTKGQLVVIDRALKRFVERDKNIKQRTSRVKTSNADAVESGAEQGRNLKIAKGIESKGNTSRLSLTGN